MAAAEVPSYQHVIIAGKNFTIHLADYFDRQSGVEYIFTSEDLPESFILDPMIAALSGHVTSESENTQYQIHVKATSLNDASSRIIQVNLIVVAPPEEAKNSEVTQNNIDITEQAPMTAADMELESEAQPDDFFQRYAEKIHEYIEYIINQHFIYLLVHDAEKPLKDYGQLIQTRLAKTGWTVYEFENCLCINAGELTYAEGNRHRYIETLREFYRVDVVKKNWQQITLVTNTEQNMLPAWIMAKQYKLPINNEPPTLEAVETLLRNEIAGGPKADIGLPNV
ncbi:MAG: hypothetical protein AAGG80_03170 [Pseudomonadota bacterium]